MFYVEKKLFERWSICIFLMISKGRNLGVLHLNTEVSRPYESEIYKISGVLDNIEEKVLVDFAGNIIEQFFFGFDIFTIDRNIEKYTNNIVETNNKYEIFTNGDIRNILNFIWETLRMGLLGTNPYFALYSGRLSIPIGFDFTKTEMEDLLRKCSEHSYYQNVLNVEIT